MAAEFDTQPNHTDEDDRDADPVRDDERDDRGIWGILVLLVLAAIILLLLLTRCTARVPNVVGLSRSEAKSILVRAGLSVGEVSELPAGSGRPGVVREQAPEAGTIVREDTSVDLMIPIGTNLLVVPDVVGLEAANASIKITQAGFAVQSGDVYSDTVPLGVAVEQSPVGGTRAEKGSAVSVFYSLGPQSEADVSVSHSDTDDGVSDAEWNSTGRGDGDLIMPLSRAYPGASAWSSGGDIFVRTSPGARPRRVTNTAEWDTDPVISPSHKYLVFRRAPGPGERATSIAAISFTNFKTYELSLPDVKFVGSEPEFFGKPIFAPTATSTRANSDWIVLAQYWPEQYWGGPQWESARLVVCNVPIGSSWVSWNERLRPARTVKLRRSTKAGCIEVEQTNGSKRTYRRDFNVTTGLYVR